MGTELAMDVDHRHVSGVLKSLATEEALIQHLTEHDRHGMLLELASRVVPS